MKNVNFSEALNKMTYADVELSTNLKAFQSKAISKFINANFTNYIFDISCNEMYSIKIHLSEIEDDKSVLLYITTNIKGRKVCYLQINDRWIDKENRCRECFSKTYQSMLNELTAPLNII